MSESRALTRGEASGQGRSVVAESTALRPLGRVAPIDYNARLDASLSRPVGWGYAVVLAFVGGLGGWAALAPLSGGAMAPGVVSPEGHRKAVQHLEGGIVAELKVRDGDMVEAGQPLVVLASVAPKASFDMLADERRVLMIKMARLQAEKAGKAAMQPPQGVAIDTPDSQSVMRHQQDILRTRHERFEARRQVLAQKIAQLNEQKRGAAAQVKSAKEQLALIREEYSAKNTLLEKGYLAKPEALRLKRMEAEIEGRHGEFSAAIARAEQQIGETRLELLALEAERADQIAAETDKVRNELAQVLEKLRASEDVLKRTVVTAPVAGSIVNLRHQTVGGVVQRGEIMMEVVPSRDKLMIEARISPLDVDIVHGGLKALVHFTAYSSRNAPRISGTIKSVSADRLLEGGNINKPYYLASVEVDKDELKRLAPYIQLIPGMPADVLIVTQERTMLDYLIQPFRDALRRGFREASLGQDFLDLHRLANVG
jgi:HlyD family secretion protein/epimerase transport system membrane fusion protein